MKYALTFAFILVIVLATYFITSSILIATNWYPLGYPVEQGEFYRMEWIRNEGTPIEERSIHLVRVDSVYKGYVIRATCQNQQIYTDGSTMYNFLGRAYGGPDKVTRITPEEFYNDVNLK